MIRGFARAAAGLAACLPLVGCLEFHQGPMPGGPQDATYADVAGAHVRYVDVGPKDAPAVVLVHGFASSLETWATVMPALAEKHRVLAMDLKGFGWTDRPDGDYSPAAEAALVLALMDARGIKEAELVGHSWGSSVVLAMALLAPSRVKKVALYDAWVYEDQIPAFFVWARAGGLGEALFALFYDQRPDERMEHAFFDKERYLTEDFIEAVERALDRPGTKAAALAATRGQRYDEWQGRYRTIKAPVLLLWGRDDEVTTLPYGERLARDLPDARLVVYPRCGHFPMIEAAVPSTRELARFLDDERSAP